MMRVWRGKAVEVAVGGTGVGVSAGNKHPPVTIMLSNRRVPVLALAAAYNLKTVFGLSSRLESALKSKE